MNIWIFIQYAITPDMPGGTRHFDLGRELVGRGHEVTIIATSFHHQTHKETRLGPGERWKIEDVDGVRFVWLRTPHYWRNDWRRVRNMLAYMVSAWRHGRKLVQLEPEVGLPDVIIGSSPHLLTPLAAYWVARFYRVPFVMEVRDLWPQTFIDLGAISAAHPIARILKILERFLYRRAERIIILGPQMNRYISASGVDREKIVWIPNGVDLSRFEVVDSSVQDNGSFEVLYLGAHGRANALDVVVQSAKIVQDRGLDEIRFVLVGDGPEKPRLIAQAQELGLQNVEFCKPVPKAEVPKILHTADAFIFNLEKAEVLGYGVSSNKLFDYMLAAKPVIFSVNAANNPVEEVQCGFTVPPRNPEALAEAVVRLYQMPQEEREAMGRRGREYVKKHHDITQLAKRLEHILNEVAPET